MGVHENIGIDKFPKQSERVGREVDVCFNYDARTLITGRITREDREAPFLTIIVLSDGRTVLDTECQYSFRLGSK